MRYVLIIGTGIGETLPSASILFAASVRYLSGMLIKVEVVIVTQVGT